MKDRLIEIIKSSLIRHIDKSCRLAENIAEDILSEGVIVPPCKVGQMVYVTDIIDGKICECEVISVKGFAGEENTLVEYEAPKEIPNVVSYECSDTEIGTSIFLTREEAEKALNKESEDTE